MTPGSATRKLSIVSPPRSSPRCGDSKRPDVANCGRGPEVRSGTIRATGRCPGASGPRLRTRRPARWPGRLSSAGGDLPTGSRGPAETPERSPSGSAQLVRRGQASGRPAPMSLMRTYRRALGLSQSAFAAQLNVPLETYLPWGYPALTRAQRRPGPAVRRECPGRAARHRARR